MAENLKLLTPLPPVIKFVDRFKELRGKLFGKANAYANGYNRALELVEELLEKNGLLFEEE